MPLLSDVEFVSFLVYSPKGTEQASRVSKTVCYAIKSNGIITVSDKPHRCIPWVVAGLVAHKDKPALNGLFANRPVLVPAPRSSVTVAGGLYPTKILCDQMVAMGLGSETRLLLERTKPVTKAAAAASSAERPTAQEHYASLKVDTDLVAPAEIVVVDDVITRGTMFLASVSRLKESFPKSNVRAFALVRTMSGQEVPHFVDICQGSIHRRDDGWGRRTDVKQIEFDI